MLTDGQQVTVDGDTGRVTARSLGAMPPCRARTMPDGPRSTDGDHRTRPRRRGHAWTLAILQGDHRRDRPSRLRGAEHRAGGRAGQGEQGLALPPVAEQGRAGDGRRLRPAARRPPRPIPAACAGTCWRCFAAAAELLAGPAGTAIRGLVSDALRDPELAAQLRRYTRAAASRRMRDVVRRAMERGELPPGRSPRVSWRPGCR